MSPAIGFTKAVSLALLGMVLAVSVAGPSAAASVSADLASTRQQIIEIRKRLAAAQGRAGAIKKEVGLLDAQLGTLNKQIVAGQRDISALESGMRTAQVQIGEAEARYGTAAKASNERARRLYISGPAQSVAILFSAESVKELTRAQFWMEKTAEVDSKTIVDASRLKSDLVERQQQLSRIKSNLDAQKSALEKRKALAAAAVGDRTKALGAVEKEIAQARQHVQSLEADSQRLTEVLKKQASQSASRPARVSDASGEGGAASKAGFVRPVPGPVTSPFGSRWGRLHAGTDFDGNTGDPIRAAKGGTVLGISCGGGYGICTLIDHGDGTTTLYGHMSRKVVTAGRVETGQVIGAIGCTGSCTGSSLHFEIRVNGAPRNPMSFL